MNSGTVSGRVAVAISASSVSPRVFDTGLMRPDAELERLMAALESDLVEREESLPSNKERIYQAICAFMNDMPGHGAPGVLFIGVRDNGQPTGLPVTDELLNTLAQMRTDGNVQPIPDLEVQRRVLGGHGVAVLEVHPASNPPARYKGQTWIRVGPTRSTASMDQERRMTERRISKAHTFDQSPCLGASLEDLYLPPFRDEYLPRVVSPEVLSENNRAVPEQLASLRLFDNRRNVPTYAGLLLFGVDPRNFMPGAYVQVVRYAGSSVTDRVSDQKEISGSLLTQLRMLDEYLPLLIEEPLQAAGSWRTEAAASYPRLALRELTWNALLHRNYESTAPVRLTAFADRIEIQSPGGLYGEVTKYSFGLASSYRNPVIAEAMKALGYVERFGTGVQRAREAMKRNGNPPPEFEFDDAYVLATLRGRA
jgi:ATP-dependent DNA helicase RecG